MDRASLMEPAGHLRYFAIVLTMACHNVINFWGQEAFVEQIHSSKIYLIRKSTLKAKNGIVMLLDKCVANLFW